MSEEDKTTYDLKDVCDPWSPEEAARMDALGRRALVELLDENNRLRAELKKAGRRGVEVEKGGYLTIVAGNAEIIVKHDDDGVAVDIWPLEDVKTDSPLGSTWVTHNELQGDEE